jgi:RNA polymerase sigma-70 factor (ECF subfamily)
MAAGADDLVARARTGDAEAFAGLVAEHGPDVLRLCMLITTEPSLAEDAAQNTWHRAWQRLDTVRDTGSLRPWLLRVAANEAKQVLRRNRRHAAQTFDAVHGLGSTDAYQDVGLGDALRALKPADRELLALRYVLGLSSEEIGRHVGLSAEGVRSRLKRIRDRLRRELEQDE